ncbi:hypothetical protein EJ06DRAFT_525670 [Trichodelitschia bisporula]|uniref:Alpha-taxilin n=1 Tax=Trichodelitschia bisporula TaxID=703511 RepID=A0A6G1IA11_9PEZI|nr:hypothetical protein EJ06DRAFT_525670 [Trichodelitschia bisporula]
MPRKNVSATTPMAPTAATAGANPTTAAAKRGKGKKAAEPVDTNKLLEQTVARLERDAAGDREQDAEIEREVKKANRDIAQQAASVDALERIDFVQKKYTQLYGDMKRLEREYQKAKKRADVLQKEKDTAKSELSKTTTIKEKLEKLSRETNNENRKLRADVQRLEAYELKLREELQDRLDGLVSDVEAALELHDPAKQESETYETDEMFRAKFKSFVDQHELRELHFQSQLRQKDLEIQYHLAKLEHQRKVHEMESSKSHQLTRQVSTFSQTETELRSQLNIYVEKFKQVEDTLNNSNDLFLTFRREMEEMSKKTKRLEKENLTLTRKQEATNQNILKMAEERTRTAKEMEVLRKKNENLEKLCRGMQAQGRGQVNLQDRGTDIDQTDSEYDDEDDEAYDDASEEYDDDTEEETLEAARRPFGPVPPPPPPPPQTNGAHAKSRAIGQVNGIKV